MVLIEHDFFLSEIIGRKVYNKKGKIGRFDDMVIIETGLLPIVTCLVVNRSFGHPSLLVPWEKVVLISNTEILLDVDSPEKYESLPGEGSILLRDHILDKKILDMDDHEVEVVYDVKLVFQNGRLHVSEVDFSRQRLLRRLGLKKLSNWVAKHSEEATLSWIYVQRLPEHLGSFKGHVKLKILKESIRDIHPVDLADILEELDDKQRVAVFKELEPGQASETLEEVEPRVQRELIGSIENYQAAQLLNKMSPVQVAGILSVLPAAKADELLQMIETNNAFSVRKIINQHDENILLFATHKFMKMPKSTQVHKVMTDFRKIADDMEVIMYVYVTDSQDTLLGVVDFRELMAAQPGQLLEEVMTCDVISLSPGETLKDAVDMFNRYSFRAIPVINAENKLLGVVSYRDIRGIKPRLD